MKRFSARLSRTLTGGLVPTFVPPAVGWDGTPKNNLVAELGDSFIANGQVQSGTDGYRTYGIVGQAVDQSNQRLRRMGAAGAFGFGGDSTLMAGARIQPAIDSGAGNIIINIGTNDEDKGLSVDDTLNELKRWKALCYTNKVRMFIFTVAPRGNDTFPEARMTGDALVRHKQRRARVISELPSSWVFVIDAWDLLQKPGTDGDLLEACSPQDAKHPGTVGASDYWGKKAAEVFTANCPAATDLPSATTSKSLNTNVEMTGAAATYGSTLPTNYLGANPGSGATGVVREYREVTGTATGRWCEGRISGAAATANVAIDLFQVRNMHTAMVVGKKYEVVCQYEIDAGAANVLSVQCGMQAFGSDTSQLWDQNRYATQKISSIEKKGWFRSPPFTAVSGLTDLRMRLSAYLSTEGAPALVVRCRNFELREVAA